MCLGVIAQVTELDDDTGVLRHGSVAIQGVTKRVNLGFVDHVQVGDYVLLHAGVALNRLTQLEAQRRLAELAQLTNHYTVPDNSDCYSKPVNNEDLKQEP